MNAPKITAALVLLVSAAYIAGLVYLYVWLPMTQ